MHDTLRYRALKPRTKRGVIETADAHVARIKRTIFNAVQTARNSVSTEEIVKAWEDASERSVEHILETVGAVFKAVLSSQLPRVITETMAAGGSVVATRARKRGSFRSAGGAGSGNFGHGGRPGEVGGSGDSTADQAKATKALSALPQHGMAAIVQSYDARKNPLNQGQSMGDDSPWTEEKTYITEAMDKEENFSYLVLNGKEKEVSIDSLTSYQTWVGPERVEAHISKLGKDTRNSLAVIYRFEGKNWIVDGNHRIAAAKLAGHKTVRAILVGNEAKQLRAAAESDTVWVPSVLPELMFVDPDDPRRIVDYAERNVLFAAGARSAGGAGSGNFGHGGRPGEVGGSGEGSEHSKSTLFKRAKSQGQKLFGDDLEFQDSSQVGTVSYDKLKGQEKEVQDYEYVFYPSDKSSGGMDASNDKLHAGMADKDGNIYLYDATEGIRVVTPGKDGFPKAPKQKKEQKESPKGPIDLPNPARVVYFYDPVSGGKAIEKPFGKLS